MQHEAGGAAGHAAEAAGAHGGAHGGEHDVIHEIHTGSWLHPLFTGEHPIINPKIFPEEVVVSLVMTVLIAIAAILLTRGLTIRLTSKRQAAVELVVEGLRNFVTTIIGPEGPRYLPVVGTVFIYILILNLAGLIPGWKSATSNINVTIGLALSVFVYVQYHGIRANGFFGYLKHFAGEPLWLAPLNVPIHVIGELARPLSLSVRLFGNIFGEDFVIAIIIFIVSKALLPAQFPLYLLAVFTSFVQAMVFTMLTCVYIATVTVHEDHGHEHGHEHDHGVMQTPSPAAPA